MNETAIVAMYIKDYIESYRIEFNRFTSKPPYGGGYPNIDISPFLYSKDLICYISNNGTVIVDFSWQPDYRWEIYGPALMVARTPGITEDNIYRLVSEDILTDELWDGELPEPREVVEESTDSRTLIHVLKMNINLDILLQRLTFGAFCKILDIKLVDQYTEYWKPHIIKNLGFVTADRKHKKFYHYMEISPHIDKCAWNSRSIWMRVNLDIRRDYADYFASMGQTDSYIYFGQADRYIYFGKKDRSLPKEAHEWLYNPVYDRLSILKETIDSFEKLLETYGDEKENVFHKFLNEHPILLDVYGDPISKPRFYYPSGELSISGKQYLEPDFIIRYPRNKYKLVEIEKPSKQIVTKDGQPRSEVTQANFQIREWDDYIDHHYDLIKDRFPEICTSTNLSRMVIIGRTAKKSDVYKSLSIYHSGVLTYDDLLNMSRRAYDRLCADHQR